MKLIIDALVGGVLAPAAFAVLVLVICRRFGPGSPTVGVLAGTIGLAGGFFVGYAVLHLAPLWPEQAWHWLPYVTVLASVSVAAEWLFRLPASAAWALRAIASGVAGWLLVPTWASIAPHRSLSIAGLALCVLLLWSVLSTTAQRLPPLRLSLLLGLTCVAAAIVLMVSGSAKFAQLAGVVAATLGAFWLLELTRRLRRAEDVPLGATMEFGAVTLKGAAAGLAALLSGLIFTGYFNSFSDVPFGSYLLVWAAPVMLWMATLGPLTGLSSPKALAVQTAAVLLMLCSSLVWAFVAEGR